MEGTKQVAERMERARNRLLDYIMETAGVTADQASYIADVYSTLKLVKFDNVGGQFFFRHGAAAEADVMRRALEE